MLGETAEALETFTTTGTVFVQGERWNATTTRPVAKGQAVQITDINGLVLKVEPRGGQA
jgi:membrane-bound serine protease (ClpP class)